MEIEFRISEEENMHPITIAGSGLKPNVTGWRGMNECWAYKRMFCNYKYKSY